MMCSYAGEAINFKSLSNKRFLVSLMANLHHVVQIGFEGPQGFAHAFIVEFDPERENGANIV